MIKKAPSWISDSGNTISESTKNAACRAVIDNGTINYLSRHEAGTTTSAKGDIIELPYDMLSDEDMEKSLPDRISIIKTVLTKKEQAGELTSDEIDLVSLFLG